MNNFSDIANNTHFTNWKEILSGTHYEKILHDDTQPEPCSTTWEKKLVAAHPSELSEQECADLAEHVVTCSVCAALLYEYKMMEDLFDDQSDEMQRVQEPGFTIPPKVLRMWEFQDERERIADYTKIKEQRERRKHKQHLIFIAFSQIIAILAVMLLTMSILSRSAQSLFSEIPLTFLHFMGWLMEWLQIVIVVPGKILFLIFITPAIIANTLTLIEYTQKMQNRRKVYENAKTIAHRCTLPPNETLSDTADLVFSTNVYPPSELDP